MADGPIGVGVGWLIGRGSLGSAQLDPVSDVLGLLRVVSIVVSGRDDAGRGNTAAVVVGR